jgi:hypothetical protein
MKATPTDLTIAPVVMRQLTTQLPVIHYLCRAQNPTGQKKTNHEERNHHRPAGGRYHHYGL